MVSANVNIPYPSSSWMWVDNSTTTTLPKQERIWTNWHSATGPYVTHTAGTTTPTQIWTTWLNEEYQPIRQVEYLEVRLTQAELDQRQRQREEASRRHLERQARMEGARDRALELLEMVLTDEEKLWRRLHSEIMVKGSEGGLYVVEERGVHGNIRQVDEHGCVLGRMCVQPYMMDAGMSLPTEDGWVGQILAIKFNEPLLRETANWSSRRECQRPDVPILFAA